MAKSRVLITYIKDKQLRVVPWNEASSSWDEASATTMSVAATGTANSLYIADVNQGIYKIQVYNDGTGIWEDLSGYDDKIYVGTLDIDHHIKGSVDSLKHEAEHIKFPSTDVDLGTDVETAIINLAGEGYDKDTHDSLKEHLEKESGAHADTAISSDVGDGETVHDVLEDHETRISALEGSSASTPTGIASYLGKVEAIIKWNHQENVRFYIRWLFKHGSESVPTGDQLTNISDCASNIFGIPYEARFADLSTNPDEDIILYFQVGAKGYADTEIKWSDVQSLTIVLPEYVQEFRGVLNGFSICTTTPTGSTAEWFWESIDSVEDLPIGEENDEGIAEIGYIAFAMPVDIEIAQISLRVDYKPSADVTIKFWAPGMSAPESFTLAAANGMGGWVASSETEYISLPGFKQLRIWTTDPKGASHYHIQIKYREASS